MDSVLVCCIYLDVHKLECVCLSGSKSEADESSVEHDTNQSIRYVRFYFLCLKFVLG